MQLENPLEALVDMPALVRDLYGTRAASGAEPSPLELQVLVCLRDRPGDGVEDIADRLSLKRSTVSHAFRRLVDLGLIQERASDEDARRRTRNLTPDGEECVEALFARAHDLLLELPRRSA